MRIYANCKQAISEIQRDLFEMGTKVHPQSMQNKIVKDDDNYQTKELQGYSFMILNGTDKDEITSTLEWCKAEHLERISGWNNICKHESKNPGEAYKLRENVWNEFLVDGRFEYTYNERMFWQIKAVLEELKKHPDTRQAIIEVHDRTTDQFRMGGVARIPCSMYYQLMIRDGKLDIIYTMRSTDFYTHFKNDIWQAIKLREFFAEQLGIENGKFIMFAGSLHAYKKDFPIGIY